MCGVVHYCGCAITPPVVSFFSPLMAAALLEFLQAHAHDAVLDAAAMARLNDELVPAALQAWPELQDVLETRLRFTEQVPLWTAAGGFTAALARKQVFALTQLLLLQVRLRVE